MAHWPPSFFRIHISQFAHAQKILASLSPCLSSTILTMTPSLNSIVYSTLLGTTVYLADLRILIRFQEGMGPMHPVAC